MNNIWFINEHDLPPKYNKFRRRYDMCKYLNKQKYKLHIICGSFIHGSKKEYTPVGKMEHNGIDIHILKGVSYSSNIKRIFSMLSFMFKIIFFVFPADEKPDIIYASSPHLFAALGALIKAKKEKCKYILEIRDLWPETWVQMSIIKRNGFIHRFFLILEKFLYKKADKIINFDPQYDYMLNLGVEKKKIVFISNGVDLEAFDKKNNKDVIYFEKRKFNITYTGAIGIANNLDNLLDLAKEITEDKIRFNIIGYGPLKEHLLERIKSENINNVLLHNPVQKDEVPNILRKSDLLIMSVLPIELYKYGASFNKLFEYWAAAKPILFSGEIYPDYITESNSGISTKNNDLIGLTEACLKLYHMSPEQRNILGENGRKYVEEHFDWKILAKKVEKVLDEVLEMKE